MLKTGGSTLLFDPYIRPNKKAAHIHVEDLRPDYILLSHGHFDHMLDLVEIAKRSGATVIGNFEIATWAQKQGVEKTIPMNIGGSFKVSFGTVKLTAAVHSSSFPDGSHAGNPCGFLIASENKTLYYSGDTGLTMDMQLIPLWAPRLDVAVLPVGDHFTMGAGDAIIAAQWTKAHLVLPVHYDTFPPISVNAEKVREQFTRAGVAIRFSAIGEEIEL